MKTALNEFVSFMQTCGLSHNTIKAYSTAVRLYLDKFQQLDTECLESYKSQLVKSCRPQTINQRILAINKFLSFVGKAEYKLSTVKMQRKTFDENVITLREYQTLKKGLFDDGDLNWYFMVWTMGATGARISELLQIRIEDVFRGYVDLISKGNKVRRIYFPMKLRKALIEWSNNGGLKSGYLYVSERGGVISSRGFAIHLKKVARKYGIDTSVVHPHSFRHMYAKNFLQKNTDISDLADLLGHDSIETTKIYLRRSSLEQRELVDKLVNW